MTRKENLLRAIRRQNPMWVPNGMENVIRLYPPILERTLCAGRDAFGVKWALERGAEGGTYPAVNGHTINDLSKWKEQISIPDVNDFDWGYVSEQVKNIDRENFLIEGFCEMGLFERSYLLLGMEEALVSYITMPEEMEEMLTTIADYKIDFISKFDDVVDLDIVWYGDDWGTQNNLFIPDGVWRKIIKPQTKRIYDAMKERNIIINQHSCGKIECIFKDMVEIGADIWNMCQPCNDLKALKEEFGDRITFHGGIDSQFVLQRPDVTADEVRAEVRKRIDELAEGGGYIAGPSHTVPYDKDILFAMNDEIYHYGKKCYCGK